MTKPIEARILDAYELFSPSERKFAEVILEHQKDFYSFTTTELAQQAGVSKATAARFFKKLGYRTYHEAKRQMRALKNWGSPIHGFNEFDQAAAADPLAKQHMDTDIANITKTFQSLKDEDVARTIQLLRGAEKIWILGLRNGYAFATYLRTEIGLYKNDVRLLPHGGLSFGEEFASMTPRDALVAIAFRRRPRALRKLLIEARNLGVPVILVTDVSASESAKQADIVFRCQCRNPSLSDSYTSVTSLLNYLVSATAFSLGDEARERLERIDDLHGRLDDLVVPID
jgi:DNA-binding MurR/RpiR family transcriptional regulator